MCRSPVPVPDKAWAVGEFDALLAKVRDPLAAAHVFGVNVTVKEADCPAGMVSGKLTPDQENWLLLLLDEETVTEAPEAFSVALS